MWMIMSSSAASVVLASLVVYWSIAGARRARPLSRLASQDHAANASAVFKDELGFINRSRQQPAAMFTKVYTNGSNDELILPAKRVLILNGFETKTLNGKYFERRDTKFLVGGVSTYWHEKWQHMVYKCPSYAEGSHGRWMLVSDRDMKYLHLAQTGECHLSAKGTSYSDLPGGPWQELSNQIWRKRDVTSIVQNTCVVHDRAACDNTTEDCVWRGSSSTGSRGQCQVPVHVFGHNPPAFNDISQGELGTCYFLAVLASIAHKHPEVIEKLFINRELWHGERPVYTVQLLLSGQPTIVAVDDWIPVSSSGRPVFVRSKQGLNIWPMVLEKAWAKVFRSFKAIEAGMGSHAFRSITQAPVDVFFHANAGYDDVIAAVPADKLWEYMLQATAGGFCMLASTGSAENRSLFGLAQSHAYSVLEAREVVAPEFGASKRIVVLYNPWGSSNGVSMGFDGGGQIQLLFEEYYMAAAKTTIAYVRKDYVVSSQVLASGTGRRTVEEQLEFEMTSSNPFTVQIEWPSKRLVNKAGCEQLDPTVLLEVTKNDDAPGNSSSALGSPKAWRTQSARLEALSNVHLDLPGGSGKYTVHVKAHFAKDTWLRKIVLNTYSTDHVGFRHVHPSQEIRVLTLGGFQYQSGVLNGRFTERRRPEYAVDGVETYWSSTGSYVLYWCEQESRWVLAAKTDWPFKGYQGGCIGVAHAPPYRDILDDSLTHGWKELMGGQFVPLPLVLHESGVRRIGCIGMSGKCRADLPAPSPRVVTLAGFSRLSLNGEYTERPSKSQGTETYWSSDGALVINMCDQVWMLSHVTDFMASGCRGLAHAPLKRDILDDTLLRGWREWTGTMWVTKLGAGVSKIEGDTGVSLLQQESTDEDEAVKEKALECDFLIKRLDELNNFQDIQSSSDDPLFQRQASTIAREGETCGDAAQHIQNDCSKYNRWRTFADIMADEAPRHAREISDWSRLIIWLPLVLGIVAASCCLCCSLCYWRIMKKRHA